MGNKFTILLIIFLLSSCHSSEEVARIDYSLKRGVNFLESKMKEFDPNLIGLLLWNNERLNLGIKIDTGKLFKNYNEYQLKNIEIIRKKFTNTQDFNAYLKEHPQIPIDELMVRAYFCDQFGLSASFYPELYNLSMSTEYDLAHALFITSLCINKGCGESLQLDSLQSKMITRTVKYLKEDPSVTDLNTEFTAFLLYSGQYDLVDKDYLEKLLQQQNVDGGWVGEHSKSYKPYELHTTFLSIWVLGEWKKEVLKREMVNSK
ncbi:MAG: hypothetical protein K1X55_07695 [Chitinophagales bacterium]|nr:hypothetical protein [Chitinophagales bacterium]